MEEILQLTISGQFNGRPAQLSVGFEAESELEIEEVEAGEANTTPQAESSAEATAQQMETEPAEESEEGGLNELFPDEEDELPPLSADTKQYRVARPIYEKDGEPIRVRALTDSLKEEEGEDEWNDSKVTSHLYSLSEKNIVDREKHKPSGKWQYFITDTGRAAVEKAGSEN